MVLPRDGASTVTVDDAAGVLRRRVGTLPEPDHGVRRLPDSVEAAYIEAGMYTPEWVGRALQLVTAKGD